MPDVPTGLSATPGDAQVSLAWSANSDGVTTSYNVLASDDGGSSFNLIGSRDFGDEEFLATGLVNGHEYQFAVVAYDGSTSQPSDPSAPVSATPTAPLPPPRASTRMSLGIGLGIGF